MARKRYCSQPILQGLFFYRLVMSKVISHRDIQPLPSHAQSSPSALSITARQTPHAGGLQLLYGFTKQERKQKSMDSLLFFLLISFGDFNKAHLCDKHTYFNMPLTININQKRAKTSGYPEAADHRITSKEGTLPQETALCL